MKKIGTAIFVVVFLTLPFASCFAAESTKYEEIELNLTKVEAGRELLNGGRAFSQDEMYFVTREAAGSSLLRVNGEGIVTDKHTFEKHPTVYPIIECIAKKEDTLMLGMIDAENQSGAVSIRQGVGGKFTHHLLNPKVQFSAMAPAEKGILAAGSICNSNYTRTYYLTLVSFSAKHFLSTWA